MFWKKPFTPWQRETLPRESRIVVESIIQAALKNRDEFGIGFNPGFIQDLFWNERLFHGADSRLLDRQIEIKYVPRGVISGMVGFDQARELKDQLQYYSQDSGSISIGDMTYPNNRLALRNIVAAYASDDELDKFLSKQTEFMTAIDNALRDPVLDHAKKTTGLYKGYFEKVAASWNSAELTVKELFNHVAHNEELLGLEAYQFIAAVKESATEASDKFGPKDKTHFHSAIAKLMEEKGFDITPGQANILVRDSGIFNDQERESFEAMFADAVLPSAKHGGALIAKPGQVVVPNRANEIFREEAGPASMLEQSSLHGVARKPSPKNRHHHAPKKDF